MVKGVIILYDDLTCELYLWIPVAVMVAICQLKILRAL